MMNLCLCGCNQECKNRFVVGHNLKIKPSWNKGKAKETNERLKYSRKKKEKQLLYCECGCKQICNNRFVRGHSFKGKKHKDSVLKIISAKSSASKNNPSPKQIKFRASLKGSGNPFFGKYHTEKVRNDLSIAASKKVGERNPFFGKHHKQEPIKILSEKCGNSGAQNGFFGKHHSEESRKLMSLGVQRVYKEKPEVYKMANAAKRGKPSCNKGKHFSPEVRKNMSIGQTGRKLSDEHVSKIFKHSGKHKFPYISSDEAIIKMRSNWEVLYAHYLDSQEIIWIYEPKQFKLSNSKRYRPDFYLPERDEYHEVKGYLSNIAKEKMDLFEKEYPNIKFKMLMKKICRN